MATDDPLPEVLEQLPALVKLGQNQRDALQYPLLAQGLLSRMLYSSS